MNQQLFEKQLCNQSSHYKNIPISVTKGAITCYHPNQHLLLSAKYDMNGTQWKTLVLYSMKHALYILWYAKKNTSWVKTMSNSEKIKPIVLAIVELC